MSETEPVKVKLEIEEDIKRLLTVCYDLVKERLHFASFDEFIRDAVRDTSTKPREVFPPPHTAG